LAQAGQLTGLRHSTFIKHNLRMTKPPKAPISEKTDDKMPVIQRSAVKPTHFTRAEVRRAVRAVISERRKVQA
jgi:hypothetical protein